MNDIFDKLFTVADSADSLDKFLSENTQAVNEFYNSYYSHIVAYKDSIYNFILLKSSSITQLDYTKSYNKSFVLMLLDYCERFNFLAAVPRICTILNSNNIAINSRLQAALLFLYPKPRTNSELVDKFDAICEKLQLAIETEEDDDNKSIATFLNYYGIVVHDTSLEFAKQVKNKILSAIQNKTYDFLKNDNIATIADIALSDLAVAYTQIQNIIDKVLGKEDVVIHIPDETKQEFIIETDTDYSRELLTVSNDFDSIRSISVRHAGSEKISGRGVKILESEEELFGYSKSFGNMHKAKLQSAFDALPDNFFSKVNIIDWGCGQGFASMIFIEKYGIEKVNQIALIEPSEIAIKRAALHCKKYSPKISIKTICKRLDDLTEDDLGSFQYDVTIHLFSNILDIDDYSHKCLVNLIETTQSNTNYFVCVSPCIDDIKTERLESFKRHFERLHNSFELLLDVQNSKNINDDYWNCNNNYKNCRCFEHEECGCHNQWTRVIKVFKVNFQ